ncbi:MAG: SelL-related redox protein [Bryobacteraceae bacterium]
MKSVLRAAGIYNMAWGIWAVAFPGAMFSLAGLAAPNYPELWQCIGMIVGVYGVAYWIAGRDPVRHWPVVLAGLLGKILGPIGFVQAAVQGRLPWKFGVVNITNDLIWWLPFSMILWAAYKTDLGRRITTSPDIQRMSLRAKSQFGVSLVEMSQESPVMLVFLRHFGCTFCREALADLAEQRKEIAETGTQLAIVHMGNEEQAAEFFALYGIDDVPRISDPKCALYRAFGLSRGSARALFGPKVWWRGMRAGVVDGHGVGGQVGDGFQMPGVFLIFHGEVLRTFRHDSAADRPDYVALTMPQPIV